MASVRAVQAVCVLAVAIAAEKTRTVGKRISESGKTFDKVMLVRTKLIHNTPH
jgi:hypothetical protein